MRTTVFDTIQSLKPYFFSFREIKEKAILDIKIPLNWKLGDYVEGQIKIQDQNDRYMLISIINDSTREGYNEAFIMAKKIIKNNQEEEEKIKLFNEKIEDLRKIFLESPIDKLKEISFTKNVRNKKSIRETGMGGQEKSRNNGPAQTEND